MVLLAVLTFNHAGLLLQHPNFDVHCLPLLHWRISSCTFGICCWKGSGSRSCVPKIFPHIAVCFPGSTDRRPAVGKGSLARTGSAPSTMSSERAETTQTSCRTLSLTLKRVLLESQVDHVPAKSIAFSCKRWGPEMVGLRMFVRVRKQPVSKSSLS